MYLALHLPDLPLRAATWDDASAWQSPLALSHAANSQTPQKSVLTCLNPSAREQGLAVGMNTARALARCPQLQLLSPHPDNECQLQQDLLHLARTLSPDIELTSRDTILLTWQGKQEPDLGGFEQTFPFPFPFLFSDSLKTAFSITPDLAHLQVLTPRTLSQTSLSLLLATFLPPGPERNDLSATLSSWGLRNVRDFLALKRPDLQERLGSAAADLHDIATGRSHRLLTLYRPPKDYRQHLDLDYPLETLASLLLLLRNFIRTLSARLQAHQRVPDNLLLTLHFEDHSNHHSILRIPEPTTNQEQILHIIETHLDGLTAPAPIIALTLDATVTLPSRSQSDLFQKALRDPNKFAHTLNQLSACLGRESLGVPQAQDSFRADQFLLLPPETLFEKKKPSSLASVQTNHSPSSLPLRRLRPPLSVQVLATPDQVPQALLNGPYPGPLGSIAGPFRLQSDWWERDHYWSSSEWDVQSHRGPLARLSHQPPHHWQIDGYY